MISGEKRMGSTTLVLEQEQVISPRILELREKIKSQEYVDNAIMRIAQVISNHLIQNPEELTLRE